MRQIISTPSVKAFYLNRELLLEKIRKVCLKAVQEFCNIRKIILYGSLARHEETGLSDVDLFFLIDSEEDNPLEMMKPYFFFLSDKLGIAVDLIVSTEKELPNYKKLLEGGIILYEN